MACVSSCYLDDVLQQIMRYVEHLRELSQMLISPAKCALRSVRKILLTSHDVDIRFVGVGILTEGGYQILGPTRGPHRALRNPEPGSNLSAGSHLIILPCYLRTCMLRNNRT